MNEDEQMRYDYLFDKSKDELAKQVMDAEDCITANDELMQTMDEIITLQDKMITDLSKEVEEYESGSRPPRKHVPKPVHTDEERLSKLKLKLKR